MAIFNSKLFVYQRLNPIKSPFLWVFYPIKPPLNHHYQRGTPLHPLVDHKKNPLFSSRARTQAEFPRQKTQPRIIVFFVPSGYVKIAIENGDL